MRLAAAHDLELLRLAAMPPPRCCHLGDSDARCPNDATVTIVDGDPREATYACEAHRGSFAGVAWPVEDAR